MRMKFALPMAMSLPLPIAIPTSANVTSVSENEPYGGTNL